ncbi:MAG: bifunctional glutamate N-acetyltransferase/amino-acid acetyltransferase ArgJ [Methyloligellaceae bacterium]
MANISKTSPLAPSNYPELPAISGVKLASCEAGIKYQGRRDLMLAVLDEGTTVAGTLTRSKTASSPIEWCRQSLKQGNARALIVNSGNANAFTGIKGLDAVRKTVDAVTGAVDCLPDQVFVASTGVIGEPLDPGKFTGKVTTLKDQLSDSAWAESAEAIMTTDTYPKVATKTVKIGNSTVKINGIAKGSGMIAPDMATMLAFIFTDAAISSDALQSLCTESTEYSFNAITVDGDTSTSDTVLFFATGQADNGNTPTVNDINDPAFSDFRKAINDLMLDLAHQIVKDGEGATKFVEICITGAETDLAAKKIGLAIGNSPLVKTAIAGEDANWGRIVMAVGKSGEAADRDKLSIWFDKIRVAHNGEVDPEYREKDAADHMKQENIKIKVDIGVGNGNFTIWTCDLTHGYIDINADYRS